MNEALFKELKQLMASAFTGQVTLHVLDGCVKRYELREWRQPRADQVELTEWEKGQG